MAKGNYLTSKKPKETTILKSVRVTKENNKVDPLFFDLISLASPHSRTLFGDDKTKLENEGKVREILKADIDLAIKKYADKIEIKSWEDTKGNLMCRVGTKEESKTVFSAHMDTVHHRDEVLGIYITEGNKNDENGFIFAKKKETFYKFRQKGWPKDKFMTLQEFMNSDECLDSYMVRKTDKFGSIEEVPEEDRDADDTVYKYGLFTGPYGGGKDFVWSKEAGFFERKAYVKYENRSVLGADDKVGCFIMAKLISEGVKGLYIFHVGEEAGGIGSAYIKNTYPKLLEGYERAVAFDRAGYGDVIGNQRGGECCSRKFAAALAKQINEGLPQGCKQKFDEKPATGTFTDTANYIGIVPECTNLSVGYFSQHTSSECTDYVWLVNFLIPALLQVKWEELPTERDPKKSSSYGTSIPSYVGGYNTKTSQKYLSIHTSLDRYPDFDPGTGFDSGVSLESKRILVRHWLSHTHPDDVVKAIIDLCEEVEELAFHSMKEYEDDYGQGLTPSKE